RQTNLGHLQPCKPHSLPKDGPLDDERRTDERGGIPRSRVMSPADDQIWEAMLKARFGDIADRRVFRVAFRVRFCREILRGSNGDIDLTKPLDSAEQRIVLGTAGLLLIE